MENYAQRLERLFNQARFRLKVSNISKVHAENLLVEVSISNGWLHDRFVYVSPEGPVKPSPRDELFFSTHNLQSMMPQHVGRHEFEYKETPSYGLSFSVMCEDFRHRQEYVFEGVVSMDARAAETAEISVAVTASNFRGTTEGTKVIERMVQACHVSKLIDLNTLKVTAPVPMQELLDNGDYEAIDWKALDDGDEDDY